MGTKIPLEITIVSDVMCPWCFIGKRKLESAMRLVEDEYDFRVRWEPYFLRPALPKDGISVTNMALGPSYISRISEAGKEVGIDFTFRCPRVPNTLQAHALLEYAGIVDGGQKQNQVADDVFKSYFTDGLYPSEDTLTELAEKNGFEAKGVKAFITDPARLKEVKIKARDNALKTIMGVPFFYINGHKAFSGAQEPDTYIRVFKLMSEKFPLQSKSKI